MLVPTCLKSGCSFEYLYGSHLKWGILQVSRVFFPFLLAEKMGLDNAHSFSNHGITPPHAHHQSPAHKYNFKLTVSYKKKTPLQFFAQPPSPTTITGKYAKPPTTKATTVNREYQTRTPITPLSHSLISLNVAGMLPSFADIPARALKKLLRSDKDDASSLVNRPPLSSLLFSNASAFISVTSLKS